METLKRLRPQADRATAIVLVLVGALTLILGYFGVSGSGLAAEQLPYIVSGGLGGIFLAGVGSALWLSADLRDEWTKLDRIEDVLCEQFSSTALTMTPQGDPTIVANDPHRVAAEGQHGGADEIDDVDNSAAQATNGRRRQLVVSR